ncbi:MAG TPA: LLM class flavin-dependent oxidoreductase [Alphaproteobacteria bacterium]|nr:LLM class flavin-dependent oxidoreductase [Alphaproteobacteria bacterium]
MTIPQFRLSVLDQSPVPEGLTGADALRNSIDLAKLADRLGYHRYWVAEHHATPLIACTSPEVLIGPIAAATSRMRVGSGGVMLPHYSPLKVAENFSMLSGLYPGRIDLGIGRAPGTDQRTAFALQRDRRQIAPDDFPGLLAELIAYLNDRMPEEHPFARLSKTLPGVPEIPEVWLLGSSPQSGIWAAELGLPYMFADFIQPGGAGIAARYRAEFAPVDHLKSPMTSVAISAICAPTDEEAWRLSASGRMIYYLLQTGRLAAVPTVDTANRFLAEQVGDSRAVPPGRRFVVGAPMTVKAQIDAVAREYGAEEVMVVTIVHDHQARRRSYELIAEAFGMC